MYKIPSCFYDASNKIYTMKNQSHNIDFINSRKGLNDWLDNI